MEKFIPDEDTMYQALLNKDSSFEGIFYVGVKSTGVFCRPTCTARKPKRENVEFFDSTRNALLNGYRPCKLCHPLNQHGERPQWLKAIFEELNDRPDSRMSDEELREKNIDPNRVRRWFKKHHGMTFQGYLRTLRISSAFGRIRQGGSVGRSAFESGYESLSGFSETFKRQTGFTPGESTDKQLIVVSRVLTPLGPMMAGAMDKGICLLEFIDRRMLETQLKRLKKLFSAEVVAGEHKLFIDLHLQLNQYFEGKRQSFDLPLVIDGTPFQQRVWKALLGIPFGETRSYKQQAEAINRNAAVRAVAKANGDNRISIIIPCHRVIGSNGKLVGYGGGLWRKQYLLNLEAGLYAKWEAAPIPM